MNLWKLTKKQKIFFWVLINLLNYWWYSWYPTKDSLKEDFIFLPTQNWQIDFEFMENFIKAVEKLVIKDLVIWNEKKMNAYREVISKKNFK